MTPEEFIETLGNKVKCFARVLLPVFNVSKNRFDNLFKGYFSLSKKKKVMRSLPVLFFVCHETILYWKFLNC